MANGARSPLVPSVAPLIESLRQFTPAAREQQAFQRSLQEQQLAGLGQQQELRAGQIEQQDIQNQLLAQRQQDIEKSFQLNEVISGSNNSLKFLDSELKDIGVSLQGGPDQIVNNINKLMAEKGPGSPDTEELIDFRNRAVTDKEGVFNELTDAQANTQKAKKQVIASRDRLQNNLNAINARMQGQQRQARSFRPTEFKDGTTVTFNTAGQRVVMDGSGNTLIGQDAQDAIDAGVESGITFAGEKTGAQAEERARVERTEKNFDTLSQIRKNITNLDEAMGLVQEGAGTGPIEKFFPSFRASSIKLQNLQGRLGLDVVGATTFGALSESELKFALNVALPTGLDGPELTKWLQDKKAAQQKVAANLEELTSFLGVRGNTVTKFLDLKKQQQKQQSGQQQGAPTATDAQGNRVRFINGQWVPF